MKVIPVVPNTPEWHAHRATPGLRNASDASAMMGASPYVTRADLIKRIATGITPDVDARTQALFDDGHRIEAAARPLAEAFVGEDLYPTVGVSSRYPHLGASFDGLNMAGTIIWECKSWNEAKAAEVRAGRVPQADYWQCVQQMLVADASRLVYTVSDGTPEKTLHCWMALNADDVTPLLAGWEQFDADVAAYVPEPIVLTLVGREPDTLPALNLRLDGIVQVVSNLPQFEQGLRTVIAGIPALPDSDQDFADCKLAVTRLKEAEDALTDAESRALAQIEPVEAMRRKVADLKGLSRPVRLNTEKLVKAREEAIRAETVSKARSEIAAHLDTLNASLAVPMPMPAAVTADVAEAMKGKKTIKGLRDAAAQVVASAKIALTNESNRYRANLAVLEACGRPELFGDRAALVASKQPEDLQNLAKARIAEADAREQARLDAERARIRAEEEERARQQAEQLAEKERARIREEERIAAQANTALTLQGVLNAAAPAEVATAFASDDPQPAKAPETPAAVAVSDEASTPPVAAARPGATLKLGEINARIAPMTITGDGLAALGFKPVVTDKAAKLYSEADYELMVSAMTRTLAASLQRMAA